MPKFLPFFLFYKSALYTASSILALTGFIEMVKASPDEIQFGKKSVKSDHKVHALDQVPAWATFDPNTQSGIINLLKNNDLLNVRATSRNMRHLVHELLISLVEPDLNSFKAYPQITASDPANQATVNRLFKKVPELQQKLLQTLTLKTEGSFLVHNKSSARHVLMIPGIRETLKLVPKSLTTVIEQHHELYKTIYKTVFCVDFTEEATPDQLRNQSILQHLTSSFMLFQQEHQDDNQENNVFLTDKTSKIGKMLKKLSNQRSYVSFKRAQKDPTCLTNTAFILMSDAELNHEENKTVLERLLEFAPEASLILNADSVYVNNQGIYSLSKNNLPANLKHLTVTNARGNATTIGDYFLSQAYNLKSFETAGLSNVTTIGNRFLARAKNLTSFETSGLSNVTTIGDCFLFEAENLTSFETSDLSNVTTIGHSFLAWAKNLTGFESSGLSNVTTIGDYFLSQAYNLKSFETSGLSKVITIGDHFLAGAKNLTNFETSGLSKVTIIGEGCLKGTPCEHEHSKWVRHRDEAP